MLKASLIKLMAVMEIGGKYAIGTDTGLPWKCKDDMTFFRETTMGNVCIVSMKTLCTIPNRLKGRTVIAITSDITKYGYTKKTIPEWVTVCSTVDEVVTHLNTLEDKKAYLLGGKEIYEAFDKHTDSAIVSMIAEDRLLEAPTVFVKDLLSDWTIKNVRQRGKLRTISFCRYSSVDKEKRNYVK